MLFDIGMCLVFALLTIGLITRELDWLIVYYGCAPKALKDKMNSDLIMLIAWGTTLLCAMLYAASALSFYFGMYSIRFILHKIIFMLLMIMILLTFHISMDTEDKTEEQ